MRVELKNVSLAYGDKSPLFQNLNLRVEPGDFVTIRGPSGCGKSSLLRLINRLQSPSFGQLTVDDLPIEQYDVTGLRRSIGYVQQVPVMIDGFVRDNLNLAFQFKTARSASLASEDTFRASMDEFLLNDIDMDEPAGTLSVGQKQRIALIRALLTEPRVLLFDEPTSALDDKSRSLVESWLARLNLNEIISVVLVTHLNFDIGEAMATR